MTTKRQRISHFTKMAKIKQYQNHFNHHTSHPCPSEVWFFYLLLLSSWMFILHVELLCALFLVHHYKGLHLHISIYDEHWRTRLVLFFILANISSSIPLLRHYWTKNVTQNQQGKKGLFQGNHSGFTAHNVMLGREQGSSKQTKGCTVIKWHTHIINTYINLIFNQLFYLYLFKINLEYFDIVMYISANKVNVTHSYYTSARIDITQHSWAGRGFWTSFLAKTETAHWWKFTCPQRRTWAMVVHCTGGERWGFLTGLILQVFVLFFFLVQKPLDLPDIQVLALKAKVNSYFSKTPCTRPKKQQQNKQKTIKIK